jgi:hypothetical protein
MRYYEVTMKDGKKNYLSYDAVELQKNEISKVVREVDRYKFLEGKKVMQKFGKECQ